MNISDHSSVAMLERLGGDQFIDATGAKDFVSGDVPLPMMRFRLPPAKRGGRSSFFEILAKVEGYLCIHFELRKGERVFLAETRYDVPPAELQEQFTAMTGLPTVR